MTSVTEPVDLRWSSCDYLVAFLLGNKIHLVNKAEDHRVRGGLLQRLHALLVPLEVALLSRQSDQPCAASDRASTDDGRW